MKINRIAVILFVALAAIAVVGCAKATDAAKADLSGTATKYFDAHGGGYIGEAVVTTNADGAVTSAVMNEWQGPSGWAEYIGTNSAYIGGEVIRFKMAGKNPIAVAPANQGYAYFYYNINSKGWVELTLPTATTTTYTIPSAATAAATPNFDAKMASPLFAEAYVAACKAQYDADATNDADLATVTITATADVTAPTVAVSAILPKTSCHYGHLNKSDSTATYMPMSLTSIGYRENTKALLAFFKVNPTANYETAVLSTTTPLLALTSDYATAVNYPAGNDAGGVWLVADAVSGATYSDFRHYALELQNAYLYAISAKETGVPRALR